jgi:multidrug resistance efflux pump
LCAPLICHDNKGLQRSGIERQPLRPHDARTRARAEITKKLTIRAPISGTVLQVNAKPGELAGPSSAQPLLVIGDVSALRVRVELEERDFGEIKDASSAGGDAT